MLFNLFLPCFSVSFCVCSIPTQPPTRFSVCFCLSKIIRNVFTIKPQEQQLGGVRQVRSETRADRAASLQRCLLPPLLKTQPWSWVRRGWIVPPWLFLQLFPAVRVVLAGFGNTPVAVEGTGRGDTTLHMIMFYDFYYLAQQSSLVALGQQSSFFNNQGLLLDSPGQCQ